MHFIQLYTYIKFNLILHFTCNAFSQPIAITRFTFFALQLQLQIQFHFRPTSSPSLAALSQIIYLITPADIFCSTTASASM